ncbi:MAG: sulfotransferase [Deltaproteobacteria bacterium]|nr:sulfotransferase [Deltaproteobacteria bacterium]
MGMPRSGTTLIEQIIASHPLVFGAGELLFLPDLVNKICADAAAGKFPECVLGLDMEGFERIGSAYIEKIREYSDSAQHITDKLPHNFMHVGLINKILPNAKVIHCVRNPLDNCLSIFKTDFMEQLHRYAYDLVETGQYYTLYLGLMAHWEKVMPGFMYTLKYEDVVSDQQKQIKGILNFCGLPWDEACLNFHKTKRKVVTASLAQVRQPIYKDSVELWKRYEKQLEPLRKVIGQSVL